MMFTCVSITGCKMQEFIKECVPFIIALLIALLLLSPVVIKVTKEHFTGLRK